MGNRLERAGTENLFVLLINGHRITAEIDAMIKTKPCEIYRRMYDAYREAYFIKKQKLNMGLPP